MSFFKNLLIIVTGFALLFGFNRFCFQGNNDEYDENAMSKVTDRLIELMKSLEELEFEVRNFYGGDGDPYFALIILKLNPLFTKLASLKKQTEIYENMERMEGGPKNFMETALRDANKMAQEIPAIEKQYRAITYRWQKERKKIRKIIEPIALEIQDLFFQNSKELEVIAIKFPRMIDIINLPRYTGKYNLKSVLTIIRNLRDYFGEYEKTQQLLSEALKEIGIQGVIQIKQVSGTPAEDIALQVKEYETKIEKYIEKHFAELTDLGPIVASALFNITDAVTEKESPQYSEHKDEYENLMKLFDKDLHFVKKRIDDLKYPRKVKTEL